MNLTSPPLQRLSDVPAPAKLNLFLHVTGRRDDGYHCLQSVFMLIDWADTLNFDLREDGRVIRHDNTQGALPEQDLCVRAALALQEASGCPWGVDIRVPLGSRAWGNFSPPSSCHQPNSWCSSPPPGPPHKPFLARHCSNGTQKLLQSKALLLTTRLKQPARWWCATSKAFWTKPTTTYSPWPQPCVPMCNTVSTGSPLKVCRDE